MIEKQTNVYVKYGTHETHASGFKIAADEDFNGSLVAAHEFLLSIESDKPIDRNIREINGSRNFWSDHLCQ